MEPRYPDSSGARMRVDVENERRLDLNKQLMGRAHKDITLHMDDTSWRWCSKGIRRC